ncbi:MAG: ISAs1 family transposase [Proteobacteria bacterium]|nr:ISAs1 family transposase [Pseudomonadota bacterium]
MYDLPHLLLFCILGLTAGAKSYRQLHQYIRAHLPRLQTEFGCRWRRVPAYTAIRYALRHLDVQAVSDALEAHAARLRPQTGDEPPPRPAAIAIDGKTLRGSVSQFEDRLAAQVLSALAIDGPLVLAHVVIEDGDKNHEIPAAAQLIETLGLSGQVFTLDALHCQKKHSTPSSTAITT